MRSPSQQVREGQPGPTELVVEPDAEVVQRHSRCQPGTQTFELMGTLAPQAEGVEEFVINRLNYLAEASYPPPQPLGPGLFRVALWWMDKICTVVIVAP
jgi:hypothetical protein